MSYKVDWHRIPKTRPPENTFKPLWIMTDEGMRMGRFNGTGDGQEYKSWNTGHGFSHATHWAYIVEPAPPDGSEDDPYRVIPLWKDES